MPNSHEFIKLSCNFAELLCSTMMAKFRTSVFLTVYLYWFSNTLFLHFLFVFILLVLGFDSVAINFVEPNTVKLERHKY